MAIDQDQRDVILEALQASDAVDTDAVDITGGDGVVVLRGTVATFEESTAVEHIASQHVPEVRNELQVDPNLREGARGGTQPPDERRSEALRGSSFDRVEEPDDLVSDTQDSLDENVSWDPPHAPVEVPTRAEERGRAEAGSPSGAAEEGELLDDTADSAAAKSLPDVAPEELRRAAHPSHDEERG